MEALTEIGEEGIIGRCGAPMKRRDLQTQVRNNQTFFKKRFDPKGASFRFASYRFQKTVKQNMNQYAYNVGSDNRL
ncbi:MAG: hypothetical protein DRP18_04195 [Candidatus Aenigmatarchaeota archaeon]|nr:MAG: hypothetical protein DRP18_04195 [Candidatus Aenigmarchaeota archaeon]